MRALGHVIYNPAYTYTFQLKTTIMEGIMDNCRKQEKLFLTPTIICTLVLMYTKAKIQWTNYRSGQCSVNILRRPDSWSLPYFILINSTQLHCSYLYMSWFENAFRVKDHKIPFLNWINLQCKIVAGSISKTWTGSILPKSFFLSSYGFCVADHPA